MLDEAGGSYTLHKNPAKPDVFVIGGIGITPIRSILMHAAKSKLPHKLYLFYSNRTPQDAPFFDELQKLPKLNPNFTFIPTMTKPDRLQNWPGETGYVDKAMLERHLGDIHAPIYYVTGPPAMVKGIQQMLARAGIDDEQVRVEEFFGY
jgi:ferredoxin-NADP reductase